MTAEAEAEAVVTRDEPFFQHGPEPGLSAQPLQNDTRYLSAAVYLDRTLADRVIAEYVDDEHRAIVPSFGFDLGPVVLHALRARRLRLLRDLVLGLLWPVCMVLLPFTTFTYGLLLVVPAILLVVPWRRLSWPWRIAVFWVVTGPVLLYPALMLFLLLSSDGSPSTGLGTYDEETGTSGIGGPLERLFPGPVLLLILLAVATVFAAVFIGHIALVYRILARELRPGTVGAGPPSHSERVGRLLKRIVSAQRGNVTLYSGENPFLGAGDVLAPWSRSWSVVLELDRAATGPLGGEGKTAPVDPAVMHDRIRAALHGMRDQWPPPTPGGPAPDEVRPLPPNERIAGLVTGPHIVASGLCAQLPRAFDPAGGGTFHGHPLIDGRFGVPYAVATPAGIDALVRHSQSGIRCYQRVTVGAWGQAVTGRDGRPVAPAEDQAIAVSCFVHLAVEGRMLYGQFVATALPPIRRQFRVVDALPDWSTPELLLRSLLAGWRRIPAGALLAWPRVVKTCWQILRGTIAAGSGGDPAKRMVHDYGARISVRELAAEPGFTTFLQTLDTDKYIRLIERRVNEALLDHLSGECGIDVSAYRAQAATVLNEGVIMTGGTVNGQVAAGHHVRQSQHGVNP
ncbi:hypothetical protein [Actinomadura macrotermitis]|uniref:Uncharacterized protein n=1 Tax=Actinomadura macrotermitis TaxID=2585200 RepID=A0A7K0BU61_9ACTN|nr:hypothetical protein [Actinomadura macrotermitis]MQY04432.1 hypothetical protein [Actinomadura macrotermitis]